MGSRARCDLNSALHAGFAMAWRGTIVEKLPGLRRCERNRAASSLANDPTGARPVLIYDDVVFGAFPVDQIDLHGFAFMHYECGIDGAIYIPTDPDIDHPAFGDAGAQRKYGRSVHVARHRVVFHRRRGCCN